MKTSRLLFGMALVSFMAFAPIATAAHKGNYDRHEHKLYTPYWVPDYIVRAEIRHVYFPKYDIYFDRWNGTYIYFTGMRWLTSPRRPFGLRTVDFARSYKVGLAINSPRPFVYHTRNTGSSYYRKASQNFRYGYRYSYGHRYPSSGHYHGKPKYVHDQQQHDNKHRDQRNRNNGRRGRRR